ncbi:hypothetical protein HAL07_10980 [Helicobacter ailurogastricus]|uniref:Uncharacterized protein n=1 Tax=Helicobacter ailurogastricus TaxID=1578720 RepID=A0A0K2Y121_9HELI|nr:hypothetical protein ASB7_16760 [Helicobacter ailurogastricus]CRF52633.1 hypothetical protein HAL07_10980 [Helicobacter ailurogastricus]
MSLPYGVKINTKGVTDDPKRTKELFLLKIEVIKGVSRLKESAGVLPESERTEQA